MKRIMVCGIGTDVGKTVVSAILTKVFEGDYWKPVQSGDDTALDTTTIKSLLDAGKHCVHPAAYSLKAPLSPHHAASLEGIEIDVNAIKPPLTSRPLIIEGVGGIRVPLTEEITTLDLFKKWQCGWIIVSKHYLGSINHTLLTVDALKREGVNILGLVFNGDINPYSESAIANIAKAPVLARLYPEEKITKNTIERYVSLWKPHFINL